MLACLQSDYTIEMDEAYFIARVTTKCRAVIACCPGVADERLRLLGWEPAAGADAALARALELSGAAASAGGGTEADVGTEADGGGRRRPHERR